MIPEDRAAFERELNHFNGLTKTYLLARVDLIEKYVADMNAVAINIPLIDHLLTQLQKESETLLADYRAEMVRQGLPPEV